MSAITTAVMGSEFGLHLLFCMGQSPVDSMPAPGSAGVVALAGRLWCSTSSAHLTVQRAAQIVRMTGIDPVAVPSGMPAMAGMPPMPGMAGGAGAGMHAMGAMSPASMFTPSMLAAHAAAALIAGWLLRRGEAALWQAVRLSAAAARRAVLRPVWVLLVAAAWVVALVAERVRRWLRVPRRDRTRCAGRCSSVVLQHVVVRRGPPCGFAVA